MIRIEKLDEVFIKVHCDDSIAKEISSFFTFKVPNHQYTPAFKKKKWDGTIKLFNYASRTIYSGLVDYIEHFLNERKYQYSLDGFEKIPFEDSYIDEWLNKQIIYSNKKQITPHDYQLSAVKESIKNNRILLVSPTGSGKSLIIYLTLKFLLENFDSTKYLILVPTTGLVTQLASDFKDYSNSDKDFLRQIHLIFQGQEKTSSKRITISTWQSIFREDHDYFSNYHGIFGDEVHLYKAKSLSSIMKKLLNTPFRIGTTGTLDNTQAHKLIIEGLFGRVHSVTTTKNLMDDKILSTLNINSVILSYDVKEYESVKKARYADEMEWLICNKKRNNFISKLCKNISGNILVLFNYVDKHGIPLYDQIKKESGKETFMISGKTDIEEREQIRKVVDNHKNSVLVASYGTCSTGINIRNINAIVFASPSKSVIRVLQSIGRGLRKSDTKDSVILFDIADDLCWKSYRNHTLRHFDERIKIYNKEKFNYNIKKIRL
jgi:superfamily II DNA or RNA helicase